jgi:trk system potassium uptake protein
MKVVILGAGQVGANLAANLATEENDITLIDSDSARLRELKDRHDINVVCGIASHPSVLNQAAVDDADIIICVTNSDEVNLAACQVAWSLYKTPTKIARIRTPDLLKHQKQLFDGSGKNGFPVDVVISPERVVTEYIHRLIRNPGSLQVLEFAGGKVQMAAVRAVEGSMLVGQELRFIRKILPTVDARVVAIYRKNRPIIPHGASIIEIDDEVFFITAKRDLQMVMNEFRRQEQSYSRIFIAGGGNIGSRLARALEGNHSVKLVERDIKHARTLSEKLHSTLVLHGDSSDQNLLIEENIEDFDLFIAVTNDDEANIMSSLLAKRLGARKVMTLINNPAYVDLVQGGEIDIAISPSKATIGSLLTHVRRGDIVSVHSLRRGAAEAIEVAVHGNEDNSKVVGKRIDAIDLPMGTNIGAIVRNGEVMISHDNVKIEADDHLIIFLMDKRFLPDIERLFQVGLTFF